MRIDVVTLFPEFVRSVASYGVVGRAIQEQTVSLHTWNPRDFTSDAHRTVDDRPYGGGPGMVMKCGPLQKAIHAARASAAGTARGRKIIYLSPQGQRLDHAGVQNLARSDLILIAGRYEGIDERLIELEVDEEWSIGDFVMSGGELAAMVMIDALARHIPGVLGHDLSAQTESFVQDLLEYPQYTRPEVFAGKVVPKVLLDGNHQQIDRWRMQQALGRTWLRRPDLLEKANLSVEQQTLLREFKQHYEQAHGGNTK